MKPPDNLWQLFVVFVTLGLSGFGGVLPIVRTYLVERHHWLSAQRFSELLSLCQFLPGGTATNFAVAVGREFFGIRGAVVALVGILSGPIVLIIMISRIYNHYQSSLYLQHILSGITAAAVGLLLAMVLKMMKPFRKDFISLGIIALAVIMIFIFKISMAIVLIIMMPLGILLKIKETK